LQNVSNLKKEFTHSIINVFQFL